MADSCCSGKTNDLEVLASKQAKVLWIVLIINLVMFFVEFFLGWLSDSTALIGDSLDMLGDALAYGTSIYVVNRSLSDKIKASQFKAYLMVTLGIVVLSRAIYRFVYQVVPEFEIMAYTGLIALIANAICLWLLSAHKNDDINFASVWVCSRNDIIANLGVLLAAALVFIFGSSWPDLLIGLIITIGLNACGLDPARSSRRGRKCLLARGPRNFLPIQSPQNIFYPRVSVEP